MKILLLSSLLLLAPLAAQAQCAIKDFAITEFKPSVANGLTPRLSLQGHLVNNCTAASAAQIRVEIKNDAGQVVQTKQAWPAGTSNMTPGETVQFDLGRLFHLQTGMSTFTASVVSVRTW
ncbi:MAG: hypothetical protein ABI386_01745 [Rhodanobacter sp.]